MLREKGIEILGFKDTKTFFFLLPNRGKPSTSVDLPDLRTTPRFDKELFLSSSFREFQTMKKQDEARRILEVTENFVREFRKKIKTKKSRVRDSSKTSNLMSAWVSRKKTSLFVRGILVGNDAEFDGFLQILAGKIIEA